MVAGRAVGGQAARAETKAQNRAAIVAAARQVFAELGYDAAGVRDVIRRTDLASGTFYNYFPDKESVFRAVSTRAHRRSGPGCARSELARRTLEEFVGDAYRVLFRFLVEDRLLFELLQRNAGPIRALFGESVLGAGVADLFEDLRAAIARGEVPPVDAEYLAGAMAGVALELGVRMADRDPPDADGAARFATELFLGGIERLGAAGAAGAAGVSPG